MVGTMSEFFKALEQAERDRQQAEQNERKTTVAPDVVDEALATRPSEPVVSPPPVVAAAPPVAPPAPPAAPPAAPVGAAAAASVATTPPPPGPGAEMRPSVFERPPARRDEAGIGRDPAREPARVAAAEAARTSREKAAAEPRGVEADGADRKASASIVAGRVTPAAKRSGSGPVLIADSDPRSVAAEAYRTLRANLEFIPSERGCRHIVITSPSMGEGKSTTVANLAVVAAQAGSRVCLVDADMRRPTLHTLFGMRNHGGFTRALSQAMPLASVAVPTAVPNLSLVVAGSADGLQPAHLLNAPRVQKVLHDPATPFELVLFDTPPIISVADALNLAAHCDGVLVVVRAGTVPPSVLRQAVRQIEQAKGRVLGVVLNRVDLRRGDAEFYRYYSAYYAGAKKG